MAVHDPVRMDGIQRLGERRHQRDHLLHVERFAPLQPSRERDAGRRLVDFEDRLAIVAELDWPCNLRPIDRLDGPHLAAERATEIEIGGQIVR